MSVPRPGALAKRVRVQRVRVRRASESAGKFARALGNPDAQAHARVRVLTHSLRPVTHPATVPLGRGVVRPVDPGPFPGSYVVIRQ